MLRRPLPRLPIALSLLRAGTIATYFLLHAAMNLADTVPDPRVKLSTVTHNWLDSIGRLEVPVTRVENGLRRHFTEHCTAVIVSPGPSPLIVTAWHCLDGYQSLIDPIQLTLHGDPPVAVQVIASGGSMEQDWAILKATQPIAGRYWIPISPMPLEAGAKISAVGFAPVLGDPADAANRDRTRQLLADESCFVVDANSTQASSTCVARQGASGGALSRTASGGVRIAGIISLGTGTQSACFILPGFCSHGSALCDESKLACRAGGGAPMCCWPRAKPSPPAFDVQ